MEEQKELFSTRDLYLASALTTLGFMMESVDYQLEGTRTVGYFNFNATPELKETEKKYWQGKLLVEPQAFITGMRGLKARVSNQYNNPRY